MKRNVPRARRAVLPWVLLAVLLAVLVLLLRPRRASALLASSAALDRAATCELTWTDADSGVALVRTDDVEALAEARRALEDCKAGLRGLAGDGVTYAGAPPVHITFRDAAGAPLGSVTVTDDGRLFAGRFRYQMNAEDAERLWTAVLAWQSAWSAA